MGTAGLTALGFVATKLPALCIVFVVMLCQSSVFASGFVAPLDIAPRSVNDSANAATIPTDRLGQSMN